MGEDLGAVTEILLKAQRGHWEEKGAVVSRGKN